MGPHVGADLQYSLSSRVLPVRITWHGLEVDAVRLNINRKFGNRRRCYLTIRLATQSKSFSLLHFLSFRTDPLTHL